MINLKIDTFIILAVVLINGLICFIQEGKAEKALDAVKNMLSTKARIKREGRSEKFLLRKLLLVILYI
ncbi:MAG: hypothetical protein ACOC1M_04480 [Halanaerobium sp.]